MNFIKSVSGFISSTFEQLYLAVRTHLGNVSAHVLGWVSIVMLHLASVPTLLAVLMGKTDVLPSVDLMVFVWAALITMFLKSVIERNFLYLTTICLGFAAQTVLMTLILFK